ncbi:MAG: ATP-binding protein [Actinomycetota bacterium]|nr:ATP-binding protein [Actinomycetota bacterium]
MKPRALLFIGQPGSGKSTVSKAVAARYHAAYVDKDTVSTGFIGLLLEQRGEAGNERENNEFYQSVIFPIEYRTVMSIAADNLRLGMPVVIDAPFSRYLEDDGWLERAAAEAAWPEAEWIVVHVTASEERIKQRVIARGNPRDEWKLANWPEFWAAASARECRWRGARHVTVDNDGAAPDLEALVGALNAGA